MQNFETPTAETYLSKIDEAVRPRLLRAIRELLNAGRDTVNVADTLKPEASFGKHIGCHPTALKVIADSVCRQMNREIRQQNTQVARATVASLRREFPGFRFSVR